MNLEMDESLLVDAEILGEFVAETREAFENIESILVDLEREGFNAEQLSELMRRLHSLSCVLRLGGYTAIAGFGEAIVALLDRILGKKLVFSETVTDVMLFAIEHMEAHTETVFADGEIDELRLDHKRTALLRLLQCDAEDVDDVALDALEEFTEKKQLYVPGADTAADADDITHHTLTSILANTPDAAIDPYAIAKQADLAFFADMMERIEHCYPEWIGRGHRIFHLARQMNEAAGAPVDPLQLEAAAYIHDFGMVFLAGDPLRKSTEFAVDDKRALHEHPFIGAEMLYRIGGWDEAVRIVMQHHEREDGTGYPEHISGEAICDGAKILAIADAIYAMTHKQSYRSFGRPLLRAVSEINSCAGTQFSKTWVEVFNHVIRATGGAVLFVD